MIKPLRKTAEHAQLNVEINVRHESGATIEVMEYIAIDYLQKHRNDQAYFFVGVNNLTEKHSNGKVTGVFTDSSNLVDIMESKLDETTSSLRQYEPKVILCHVLGLDIQVYNKDTEREEVVAMQKVINDRLPLSNSAIDCINMNANVKGPWLTDTIHSFTNGRRIHKYKRFSDGIHPTKDTCEIWARKILKAIKDNM